MRQFGVQDSADLPGRPSLFVNTHPHELQQDGSLDELAGLREGRCGLPLVAEIHEGAVMQGNSMRSLKADLAALEIGIAYDDFGAGQATA